MPPRSWQERVLDIVQAVERIQELTSGMDFADFVKNQMIRDAVLYNVVIIGEAARYVPADVQTRHSDVDWRSLRDMRNWVAHVYHAVSLRRVWKTITNEFRPLVPRLRQLLDQEQGTSGVGEEND